MGYLFDEEEEEEEFDVSIWTQLGMILLIIIGEAGMCAHGVWLEEY